VILVFGSINLDMMFMLDTLPTPGRTVIGTTSRTEPGGKGANQAAAAARDGAIVALAGAVGRDLAADAALAGLVAAGVDLGRVARVEGQTGLAAICVDKQGQNQIAVSSGANLAVRAGQVADADLGPQTTLLLQMEVDPAETASLIRRAHTLGSRIVLNLAPAAAIAEDALRLVDWLVVNEAEAAWLGTHLGVGATAAALQSVLGCGVIRTRGADGVEAATQDGTLRLDRYPVEAVDSTGAGDCFLGVFCAALDRGATLAEALRRANVAAALSCTRLGSQGSVPNTAEIDAVLDRSPMPGGWQPGG
jgi:ribokinase